ncbi:MAG: hypothetical protein MUC94_10145 [bacterium]|nr:hypothetical protein [bacterium]
MSTTNWSLLLLYVLISIPSYFLYGQSAENTPQKVNRYCYVVKPKEWYKNQERLWKIELSKNPQNEAAWYSYFFAARYGWANVKGQTNTREALMDSIYQEMGKAIPDSWVYHFIHYYNYATDFSRLEQAYQINPHASDLYWEFIKEYTLSGQKEKSIEFCKKLYESKDISTGVYNLNYNILNSTSPNSILFTNGDNDTYPAWVLQNAKGIRNDVLILTMHGTFSNRDYLQSILADRGIHLDVEKLSTTDVTTYFNELTELLRTNYPDITIHLARTVYKPYYEKFKDKLYLTGLVLTYSEKPFDSDQRNKEVIENDLRLDYLAIDWYDDLHVSEPLVKQFNLLYVDPFLKLAKYYYSKNNIPAAAKWRDKALLVSKSANDEDSIKKIEELNWREN